MAYTRINFVNNETELSADNLNKMDEELESLDIDVGYLKTFDGDIGKRFVNGNEMYRVAIPVTVSDTTTVEKEQDFDNMIIVGVSGYLTTTSDSKTIAIPCRKVDVEVDSSKVYVTCNTSIGNASGYVYVDYIDATN